MSHAFDQLLRGSPVFPVASDLRGMGGSGAGTARGAPGRDIEVVRMLRRGHHGTFELQRS